MRKGINRKKRKALSYILAFCMVFASFTPVMAAEKAEVSDFVDMPNDWSTNALVNAVENGLITGFNENGKVYIRAGNPLKRAEMASIINKAFNTSIKASLAGVTDVVPTDWFYDHMAMAVQMESFAKASRMRPNDNITREETFTVLAKVFKIPEESTYTIMNTYKDAGNVSDYAKGRIEALLRAGYISGTGNMLNPKKNITRAEFATVMDNIVKEYINTAGIVVTSVPSGNVMINQPGTTLRNLTVTGDLVIADGVGSGNVTLDSVNVMGRLVIRGGGANSVEITGNSNISELLADNINYTVRIYSSSGTKITSANLNRQTILDGYFGNVSIVGENSDVTVRGNVSNLMLAATSKVTIEKGADVRSLTIESQAPRSIIQGQGTLERASVYGNNSQINTNNTSITVGSGVGGVSSGSSYINAGETVTSDSDAASQSPPGAQDVPVSSVSLDVTDVIFLDGTNNTAERKAVKATISPSGATNKHVKWSISGNNEDRFELYDALTKGNLIKEGESTSVLTVYVAPSGSKALTTNLTATIKVETVDGYKSSSCKISVSDKHSATPKVSDDSVAKTAATQKEVKFTLTNNPMVSGTWKVYANSSGSTLASGISASSSSNTLTLSHSTDVPTGTYYVTVTEKDKIESDRLAITVSPFGSYKITGTIKGSDTSKGLAAAKLQLKNNNGSNVGGVVTTASDGTYSITGVAAGSGYTIAVSCSSYLDATIPAFAVSANVSGKDLTLSRGYNVSGTIMGSDITGGLAGASLQLKNSAGGNVGNAVSTANDGTYVISGIPAANGYTISVSCSGYTSGTITSFNVGTDVVNKNLTLTRTSYSISGKVTGSDTAGAGLYGVAISGNGLNTVSSANGGYTISNVAPGTYNLMFTYAGYEPKTEIITVGTSSVTKNVELQKTPSAYTVSFTILSYEDGNPINGATVSIIGLTSGTTGPDGICSFANVAGGAYDVKVSCNGYMDYVGDIEVLNSNVDETIYLSTQMVPQNP